MIQSVRKAAQLEGDPPEKFYTNASESTNNILKLKVDRKPQSLPAFTDHALELASSCEKNIERAFFRRGDWRFAKTFSPLEDIGETWSQKQQKSLVKRILEASCSLSSLIQEANGHGGSEQSAPCQPSSSGGAPSQPSSSGGGNLSQSYTVLLEGGSNIHEDTLRGIWTKARSLVSDQTLMAPVPGCKSTYHRMVASKTGDCPHMVTTPAKFTGQFKCDGKCAMYATYKVCSHTVAAAEVGGKLSEFLQWLIKQQVSPNLTTLSMVGILKGAGQKGGVPKNTRKRKRASTAPASRKTTVDRLSAEAPSPTPPDTSVRPSASCYATVPSTYSTTVHGQQINMQGLHGQQINMQGHGSCAWIPSNYVSTMPLPNQSSAWPYQFPVYPSMASPFPPTAGYSIYPPSLPPYLSNSGKSIPVVSPYPFTLKMLTTRVQICQGCRIPFRRENSSVQEPYDLVVSRMECRPYRAAGGETKTPSQPSNSHYHVSLQCIRSAEPSFSPMELVIPDDVRSSLSEPHKHFMYSALGIYI